MTHIIHTIRGVAGVGVVVAALLACGCGASKPEEIRAGRPAEPAHSAALAGPKAGQPPSAAAAAPATAQAPASTDSASPGITAPAAVPASTPSAPPVPASPVSIASTFTAPFTAPVSFDVMAIAMNDTVLLKSTDVSDAAGFACQRPTSENQRSLKMFRFAHCGRADSPFAMNWVLFMPEGDGVLEARPLGRAERTSGGFAYEVTLRCPLEFRLILRGATMAMHLNTRIVPEFKGYSKSWPPYGATLTLANGPIPFFRTNVNPPAKAPLLTVRQVRFTLGKQPARFLAKPPEPVAATILDQAGRAWSSGMIGGVRIEWKPTSQLVRPVEIAGYNVYRSADAGSTWTRIAQLAATQTSYTDSSYNGTAGVQYVVTHRTVYRPEFEYEGMFGPPVSVANVR